MPQPDHFMYGAPDRDAAIAAFEALTGVRPAIGGSHPGKGTCNALVSLGDAVYLEIIAPDPDQELDNTFGAFLSDLEQPGLITWCANYAGLSHAAAALQNLELDPRGPAPMSRRDPSGTLLEWELLFIGSHDLGMVVPFLIDWMDTPHPAGRTPAGCTVAAFELLTPEPVALRGLLDALGLNVTVITAASPAMNLTLNTPRGSVQLPAASPVPQTIF